LRASCRKIRWRGSASFLEDEAFEERVHSRRLTLMVPYIRNWELTRPAVMIIRGPRPANNPRKPASLPRTASRWTIEPVGPWPLLIWLRSVSAGCDRIAAAKPATMPEPRLMPSDLVADRLAFSSADMFLYASSCMNSFTANWPAAYGICGATGTDVQPAYTTRPGRDGLAHLLAENWEEASVEAGNALLTREPGEAGDEPLGVLRVRDEPDPGRLERGEEDVGKELCNRGTAEVDGRPVGDGSLVAARELDQLLLEVFVAGKLSAALEEVANGSRPETGEEPGRALSGDDRAAGGEHARTLERRVDLKPCLDD
jgi:hypothetical protein